LRGFALEGAAAAQPQWVRGVAMSDVTMLQYETVRAITASLIVVALVLLCIVAASRS
jgi:hypothetical protein